MLKLSLFSHKEYFQKCFDFSRNDGFLCGIEIYDIINIYQIHTNKNVYHRKEKGFFNKSEGIPKTKQFTLIYFQTLCFESLHPSVKILKSKIYVSLFSVILQSRYMSSKNKY